MIPTTLYVVENDGAMLKLQGCGRQYGEYLVERTKSAGQRDEDIALLNHCGFAIGKVGCGKGDVQ